MARPLRLVSWTLVYPLLGLGFVVACQDDAPSGGLTSTGGAGGAAGSTPAATAGSSTVAGQGGSASSTAGQGGSAGSSAGRGGSAGSATVVSCPSVPQGQLALLDDFEDGNSAFAAEPGRTGIWFTIHDESPGSITPNGAVVGVAGGANGSERAAHVVASGYLEWGAGLSSSLTQSVSGEQCPYNASAFAGLRFYARGSGKTRFSVQIPETVSREFGGSCDPDQGMVCFDQHGKYLTLTDDWQLFELPWDELKQRTFGTRATLRPEAIMGVQFALEKDALPAELWVDEIGFWDAGAGGEGGAGGGSGQAGDGGMTRGGAGQAGETSSPGGAGSGGATD